MNRPNNFWITLLLLLAALPVVGQSARTLHNGQDAWKTKLDSVNQRFTGAVREKDIAKMMQLYDGEIVCMPEYHPALYNKEDTEEYFRKWLQSTTVSQYQKSIYEVERIKDLLVEIGTYTIRFSRLQNPPAAYEGKYMNIWKISQDGSLKLASEIWGANQYIERSLVSPAGSPEMSAYRIPAPETGKPLAEELRRRNGLVSQWVVKRDGQRSADMFTEDAIFMHYFKPMLVGQQQIRSHLVGHNQNDISIDSIRISAGKIVDRNEFVLEHSYYYVAWRNAKDKGIGRGKSINLWKRNPEGTLMLYRQMVNHD